MVSANIFFISILAISSFAGTSTGLPDFEKRSEPSAYLAVCQTIAAAISDASTVYYPASLQYTADIEHWSTASVTDSACSVEPGTAADVGAILQVLGSTQTPFAVKGGGHNTNPGFSSTQGVHISMTRFSDVIVDASSETVVVGSGLIWDDVYDALTPTGVNVVGGRVPGVGVAGLTLGGGYSWKSSQYGLAIDNVQAYELVLPSGVVTTVTEADTDLWFGLRGGLNNFGIVTKFTLKSHPQTTDIWGGLVVITEQYTQDYISAITNFCANNVDKKAALISSFTYIASYQTTLLTATVFYDGPSPPSGIFDELLSIPALSSSTATMPFATFIASLGATNAPDGTTRDFYSGVPVLEYTPMVLGTSLNASSYWGEYLSAMDPGVSFTVALEPFDASLFSYGSGSAYPPDRSRLILPSNLDVAWTDPSLDGVVFDAITQATQDFNAAVTAQGQDLTGVPHYPNYALYDTPLEDIYGGNIPRLQAIKNFYDPTNIMGLAGGFKF
ncbi:FAD-binding domain-containing protein [Artomyces pyxidatus]|uniref:FAD-binding domain-containing protein n=1 Tax=Artomyces pyxidatus TaxID=48021 RepID=A0ACB8SN01_9AGAM|nr:FAD-binding domain-containing protein [Artomyces pyxidatus]